jgi:preprotein translocase subunit YajC
MKNKIIVIVLLIVVAGGGFYFGVQNGKASATAAATAARASFTRGAGGTARAGGAVTGQVVSVDTNSLTISLASGSSQIIFFTAATPISKTVSGSVSDLTAGTNIMVAGTTNSDGSESATSIQIRPAGFGTTTRATTGQ